MVNNMISRYSENACALGNF